MVTESSSLKNTSRDACREGRFVENVADYYAINKPAPIPLEDEDEDVVLAEAMRNAIRSIQPPEGLKEAILKGERYR